MLGRQLLFRSDTTATDGGHDGLRHVPSGMLTGIVIRHPDIDRAQHKANLVSGASQRPAMISLPEETLDANAMDWHCQSITI